MRPEPYADSKGATRRRCGVAMVLTLALMGFAIVEYLRGLYAVLIPLLPGIVAGWTYVVRGGSMPKTFYVQRRFDGNPWNGITRDDDRRNLPARVYLPILLAAAALGTLYFWLFMK